jgi:hypothetical protein
MTDIQTPDPRRNPGLSAQQIKDGILPSGRKRIPMNLPRPRMAVPEIPGYYLYWFADYNLPHAIAAGYEFVDNKEVDVTRNHPGGGSGNTALDSRVSMVGTRSSEDGVQVRATLMKLRLEWYKEDQLSKVLRQAQILEGIFDKEQVFNKDGSISDAGQLTYSEGAYTGHQAQKWKPVMNRPVRKARIGRNGRPTG